MYPHEKRPGPGTSVDQEGILNAWLIRKSGPQAGARRIIRGDVTRVGRGPDNDVVVDETTTSAHHLEIRRENGSYQIRDLNSTNGTFVNRLRVHPGQKRPLEVNDVIQIGTVQMRVTG